MRTLLACLCVLPLLFAALGASQPPAAALTDEPAALADATLHAVRFVDANEGWACGDDGLILHTIDGGKNWERQPSGVRASLRDLHFADAFTGFAVGREELAYSGGSAGVILFTDDGGVKWRTMSRREIPGLFGIRFADEQHAFLLAEASDAQPSGLFESQDGGASWKMVPGERRPGWAAGSFGSGSAGAVAGPSGLMQLRRGALLPCDAPPLGDRQVRAIRMEERLAFAVGDRGLVLRSANQGAKWQAVDLGLPPGVQDCLDFQALAVRGSEAWLVGRPGSVVVHTADGGQTWRLQKTGQRLPLASVSFLNDKQGWAVGAAGVILATEDGGANWRLRRRGAGRAAALVVSARAADVPLSAIASLGADDGYLTTVLQVAGPAASAPPTDRLSAGARLHEAARRAGGCAGEISSRFPLPQHLLEASAGKIAQAWGEGDERKGLAALEAQLALALRIWQPEVVLTDAAEPSGAAGPVGALVALALKGACAQAGQAGGPLDQLDLPPHQPLKLYAAAEAGGPGVVTLDLDNVRPLLGASASDFAAASRPLLRAPTELPEQFAHYRLLWSKLQGAEAHSALLQGSTLERGGLARRPAREFDQAEFDACAKRSQDRREILGRIRAMAKDPEQGKLAILAVDLGGALVDEDAAGEAAFLLGQQFYAQGHWPQARELFLMLLDRYPSHPLAAEANRWLIAYAASSAAKRRDDLKQFPPAVVYDFKPPPPPTKRALPTNAAQLGAIPPARPPLTHLQKQRHLVREWGKGSLVAGELLSVQGALAIADPRVQFSLQSGHRLANEEAAAQLWFTQFAAGQSAGPWAEAANAELWLVRPEGPCPKPLAAARRTEQPPMLDGKFTDACWLGMQPIQLKDAVGRTANAHASEARLAYDDEFLYLAVACRAPKGTAAAKKPRLRDDDLTGRDRVTLLLDLDRAYATPFRFEADERGCARESAWGDKKWNPKWFVAVEPIPSGGWMLEAAIPLAELSATPPRAGETWAFNLVRTLPGQGVQACGLPADVEPRLEGMGLMRFTDGEEAPARIPALAPAPGQGR